MSALTRAAVSRSTADGLILTQVSRFDQRFTANSQGGLLRRWRRKTVVGTGGVSVAGRRQAGDGRRR
ncbi:hypothetical protein HMPREF9057_01657, partial [Actinomyces sp. oral taxon 171 str. F0337]